MWESLQVLRNIKVTSERTDGIVTLLAQYRLRPEDIFDRLSQASASVTSERSARAYLGAGQLC